jgi:hypothetical protein
MLKCGTNLSCTFVAIVTSLAVADANGTVDEDFCRPGLQCYESGKCYRIDGFHLKYPNRMKCAYGSGPSGGPLCYPYWAPVSERVYCRFPQPLFAQASQPLAAMK